MKSVLLNTHRNCKNLHRNEQQLHPNCFPRTQILVIRPVLHNETIRSSQQVIHTRGSFLAHPQRMTTVSHVFLLLTWTLVTNTNIPVTTYYRKPTMWEFGWRSHVCVCHLLLIYSGSFILTVTDPSRFWLSGLWQLVGWWSVVKKTFIFRTLCTIRRLHDETHRVPTLHDMAHSFFLDEWTLKKSLKIAIVFQRLSHVSLTLFSCQDNVDNVGSRSWV
jgi:hypothetical protein